MPLLNTSQRYGAIAKTLHWVMALGLWGMFAFGKYLDGLRVSLDNLHLFGWHKSFGMVLLVLVAFRVVVRLWSPAPSLITQNTRHGQIVAAHLVHFGLYATMLTTPLFGWIASSAAGFEMEFFGLFPIPFITAPSPATEDLFFRLHEISAHVMIGLSIVHLAAAVYRHIVKRDATLRRMLPEQPE